MEKQAPLGISKLCERLILRSAHGRTAGCGAPGGFGGALRRTGCGAAPGFAPGFGAGAAAAGASALGCALSSAVVLPSERVAMNRIPAMRKSPTPSSVSQSGVAGSGGGGGA